MDIRRLIIRIVIPLVILGTAIGGMRIAEIVSTLPSARAPRRDDAVYMHRITASYPAMKNNFTIASVTVEKEHWVIVKLKNTNNTDTLRALLYDPTNSQNDIQVVAGPSTRSSFATYMSPANTSKETTDVTE